MRKEEKSEENHLTFRKSHSHSFHIESSQIPAFILVTQWLGDSKPKLSFANFFKIVSEETSFIFSCARLKGSIDKPLYRRCRCQLSWRQKCPSLMNSFVLLLCLSNNNKNSNLTNFPSPIGRILAQWISFLSESELSSQMIFGLLFGPRCIMLILLFAECFLYAYQRLIRSSLEIWLWTLGIILVVHLERASCVSQQYPLFLSADLRIHARDSEEESLGVCPSISWRAAPVIEECSRRSCCLAWGLNKWRVPNLTRQ